MEDDDNGSSDEPSCRTWIEIHPSVGTCLLASNATVETYAHDWAHGNEILPCGGPCACTDNDEKPFLYLHTVISVYCTPFSTPT
jgi:hypothetical protein